MSQQMPQKGGVVRQAMIVSSWVIGVLLILIGLAGLAGDRSAGSLFLSLGMLIAGVLVIPPIVKNIRGRVAFFKPVWAPPAAAFSVVFLSMIVGAPMLAASDAASPEGKARIAAEEAEAAQDRETEIADIERLVTEGTVESTQSALSKLNADRFREDVTEGGSLRSLFDAATAAEEAASARAEVERYIARVAEVMPRVDAVFTGRPETELVINLNLEIFDEAARVLRDGQEFESDADAREAMTGLRRALVQKQTAAFPSMRAGYGAIKDQAVWENDMDITVQGGGNRTIRFIAGIFAANRNIAEFERNVRPVLSQMRFRRTQYEWYRDSEYTYYTLETPADSEVGSWSGSTFSAVSSPD